MLQDSIKQLPTSWKTHGKEKTMPFGVKFNETPALYQAAQMDRELQNSSHGTVQ